MLACLAGVEMGCIHLCQVLGNTMWSLNDPCSSEMEFDEELHTL